MQKLIIGFTGTRQGMSKGQKQKLRDTLRELKASNKNGMCEFHHGDCLGADEEAHEIANEEGYWVVAHPPSDPKARAFVIAHCERPKKPYLVRDHDIVDECQILIAAPKSNTEVMRSGTWATIRYGLKKERQIIMLGRN